MAGEGQLARRREDADPHVCIRRLRRQHEDRLAQKFISRASACISTLVEIARVGEDGELVPGQRRSVKTSQST